ncbi:MAG: NAD(P)/FAD-dependent oxidoreductase [Clostridiales bacterium]|nr:NAD(P)/FAD-dependent oxidoreductase [Clostridiales bacterium]
MKKYDVIVIGGGVTGANALRELSKYELDVLLLESNADFGAGVTKGNGGAVHSGYDATKGSLKAKLNVEAVEMWPEYAKDLDIPYERLPSMTLAFNEEERETLEELLENGKANNVPDLRIIEKDEILEIEPTVNPDVKYALIAPSSGITEPYIVAYACIENAIKNGAEAKASQKVIDIKKIESGYKVITSDSEYETKMVVNAAGVYGDVIADMVNPGKYSITERHGSLMILDNAQGLELKATLFPVPSKHSKGMAAIPACAGNIILGSTAEVMNDKENHAFTRDQSELLFTSASKLLPRLRRKDIIRVFTGLRPVEVNSDNDFVIEEDIDNKDFYNAIGIQSPGIAASPAVGAYVVELIKENHDLKAKENYDKTRKGIVDFSELDTEQKRDLIELDPAYAHVVCRCETVTEGEILDSIRRPGGATTIDGVKRRTRAGMGRCQGGFCESRIVTILSNELGKKPEEILKENAGSEIIIGEE